MIVLLDTSESLDVCAAEIGAEVEQLLTPLTRFRLQRPTSRFAIDNGAFSGFQPKPFLSLLEREKDRQAQCIFVAVPDVVASARRTLEVFERWAPKLNGWPLAIVAQDGVQDSPIPWDSIAAVFIGGTTEFKLSQQAQQVIRAAQALEKWVHVGRVNDPQRFAHFEDLGVDSVDGSGIGRYTWMRERINRRADQTHLFAEQAA